MEENKSPDDQVKDEVSEHIPESERKRGPYNKSSKKMEKSPSLKLIWEKKTLFIKVGFFMMK